MVDHQRGDPALRIGSLEQVDQLVGGDPDDPAVQLGDEHVHVGVLGQPLEPPADLVGMGRVPELAEKRSDRHRVALGGDPDRDSMLGRRGHPSRFSNQ